jgi:hypothetical protein
MLEHLTYKGKGQGFTFKKIVEKHKECHIELSRFNEPILETKELHDFLNRIANF